MQPCGDVTTNDLALQDVEVKRRFAHNRIITTVIKEQWFADAGGPGVKYAAQFSPIRDVTLALIFTAVRLIPRIFRGSANILPADGVDRVLFGPMGVRTLRQESHLLRKGVPRQVRAAPSAHSRMVQDQPGSDTFNSATHVRPRKVRYAQLD